MDCLKLSFTENDYKEICRIIVDNMKKKYDMDHIFGSHDMNITSSSAQYSASSHYTRNTKKNIEEEANKLLDIIKMTIECEKANEKLFNWFYYKYFRCVFDRIDTDGYNFVYQFYNM
jgi:hypothetical protein